MSYGSILTDQIRRSTQMVVNPKTAKTLGIKNFHRVHAAGDTGDRMIARRRAVLALGAETFAPLASFDQQSNHSGIPDTALSLV